MKNQNNNNVKIIFCLLISLNCFSQLNHSLYIKQFKEFAENYKPDYLVNNDTLQVSIFRKAPKDLNDFLLQISRKKDFNFIKYAILILRKQHRENIKINQSDYMLQNESYSSNGYLELLRVFLKLNKSQDFYIEPLTTGDLCRLIFINRHKIRDYKYLNKPERADMR